ncbi:DNA primase [Candidatus Roizmanbacteria bacterium RIFOXYB2_FULL_41_10]|uniref:DNA primase n=1 Tax=Candidatus Roizmanbacteria bacterium RIFOXYA1_FULL_41_12 TaxID=1802082 RepID=A0A1F7KF18_9BACT|nr:MAG: DNA primase [Candidatus Roizmanbacteria bacterium RIFOXYA1_FULL_41_12]OGK67352.1 MAG: DNA primase [Candidatus Roizmanbacteria bacterium RIFOXYB1_FULL_41_27]OGK69271.1 MAG: DNA primase [Candidatus Roizmanbacteria bacterium RIFOXYB2_FULL_41_10]OGK71964.1 MAG: DNA primase [Candidatus Roizmanbacteria bacterium RIFOXYC1_FULL_41_16]OGK75371.1 MAG: DNA primase [Candidatus Roizmanbacteria bacterium RIFOXYD1_FULL_41_24]
MDALGEIKKRIDIVEFINKHVPLQKAGRNFKAPCPFHSEKTPSFVVSPDRQIWHCFGACNEGGDIFKFLMKWENLTFGEALKILAQEAGVKLEKGSFVDNDWDQKQKLITINQYAADFYQFLLEKHRLGNKARQYLDSRGVNNKTAKYFYLGYAPKSWDSLLKFLTKKGYTALEILAAGLIIKTQGNRFYDRFRSRLMFPLTDLRGNILGFSGRVMDETTKGGQEMKYMNTPETAIYHKRENLFGLHQGHKDIREQNEIMLVEGEFDAILAHQFGYKQTVAIKGSALTQDHLRLIKRLTNRIVFALDMDQAGQEAIRRSIEEAEKFDFQMHVVNLKSGKDPADVLQSKADDFAQFYKDKQTIYEYLIDSYSLKQDLSTVYGQKAVIEAIIPYLANIYNPILFDHYLRLLSEKTNTPGETIKRALFDYRRKQKQGKKDQSGFATTRESDKKKNVEETLENYLLALLVQTSEQVYLLKKAGQELSENDYYSPSTYKLFKLAQSYTETTPKEILEQLNQNLPDELMDSYNRGFLYDLPTGDIDWKKEITKNILKIKKYSLKKQIQELMKSENETALKLKLKELTKVEKTLSII